MYMAEAQVYLDRIADAIRNLNAENVNDISVNLPDDKSEQGKAGSLKYQSIPNKNFISVAEIHFFVFIFSGHLASYHCMSLISR